MVKNLFAGFGLALGVGACTALFADHTGEAPPVAGDGGKLPDGAVVDGGGGPELVKCEAPGAGCAAALVGRSFPRDDIAEGKYIVHNVAIAVANKQVYAAVQGKSSSGDGFANKGQSSWGSWPADIPVPPVAGDVFSNRELCANEGKCLGPLHLLRNANDITATEITATFATKECGSSPLRWRNLLAADGQESNGCLVGGDKVTDGWSSEGNSVWLTDVDIVLKGQPLTASRQGLWAGLVGSQLVAVYNNSSGLRRAGDNQGGMSSSSLGTAIAFPDVAKRDGLTTAYIAGVDASNQYTLVARNWDTGQDVPNVLPPISFFNLQTQAAPAQGDSPRPFRPLRVLVDTKDRLRLVALSGPGQAGGGNCDLYAFVQTAADAKIWNRHVLVSAAPCSAISFDAALDASDGLHVIYGKQDINVGYAVISP